MSDQTYPRVRVSKSFVCVQVKPGGAWHAITRESDRHSKVTEKFAEAPGAREWGPTDDS